MHSLNAKFCMEAALHLRCLKPRFFFLTWFEILLQFAFKVGILQLGLHKIQAGKTTFTLQACAAITKSRVVSTFCYKIGVWLLQPGKAVQPGCCTSYQNHLFLLFLFFFLKREGCGKGFCCPPSFRAAPVGGKSPTVL